MNITHILSSTASHKLLMCEFLLIIGILIINIIHLDRKDMGLDGVSPIREYTYLFF